MSTRSSVLTQPDRWASTAPGSSRSWMSTISVAPAPRERNSTVTSVSARPSNSPPSHAQV